MAKDEVIRMRVEADLKRDAQVAAKTANKDLTSWITDLIHSALGAEESLASVVAPSRGESAPEEDQRAGAEGAIVPEDPEAPSTTETHVPATAGSETLLSADEAHQGCEKRGGICDCYGRPCFLETEGQVFHDSQGDRVMGDPEPVREPDVVAPDGGGDAVDPPVPASSPPAESASDNKPSWLRS